MTGQPSVPQIFDRALLRERQRRALREGPALFLLERAVDDLQDRLAATLRPFPRALDIATPASLLAAALAGGGGQRAVERLSGLDEARDHRWNLTAGDAETLPYGPARFDLAVSALALQWVDDLPGTLIQIRRLLAPDGLFLACMIGGQSLQELRMAFAQAESEIAGGASPRVAPFADLRDIGALLQRAGFALPVTDVDAVVVRYADLFALMRDLRAMGATNILRRRSRSFLRRDILLRAGEIYAQRFADADGRVRATFEIIWMSGWAPHESQQKPLQPGTARMRLSDVLPAKDYGTDR